MNSQKSAKERYHFAKLALFNIRLLHSLQNSEQKELLSIISTVAKENGISETPNLLHQGTFLQFAYTCLVWLWESAKIENFEGELFKNFPAVTDQFNLKLPCGDKINGERSIKDWKSVIRLVRNALGHGRVEATENTFIFSDQNTYGRHPESEPTTLELSWEEVGKLSEVVIHSITPILWPETANKVI